MGIFGDIRRLGQMGKEAAENSDVKGSMAAAQERLNQANLAMSQQTAATAAVATDPASEARRVNAVANIVSMVPPTTQINGSFLIQFQLLVTLPGGIPLPVSHSGLVPALNLSQVQRMEPLPVSIDPQLPASFSLRIEWNRPL